MRDSESFFSGPDFSVDFLHVATDNHSEKMQLADRGFRHIGMFVGGYFMTCGH